MRSPARQSASTTAIARVVARRQAPDTHPTFSSSPRRSSGSVARSTFAHSRYRRPSGSLTSSAESAVAACHAKRRVPTPWFYPPDHWTTKHRLGRRRASSPIRAQAGPAPETSCRLIRDPHRNRYGPVQCGAVTHLVQPSCFGQKQSLA